MKTDLDEETDTTETITWAPGMCTTPDCGHPIPDDALLCPPCEILFGAYAELIAHDDVQEWQPPPPAEPEAETPPEPVPPTTRRATRRRPPPVPPLEGVQPESS